jgi:hypothetical protein
MKWEKIFKICTGEKKMDEFMELVKRGEPIAAGTKEYEILVMYSNEAMKITFELNNHYHEQEEVRRMFSKLTGKKVDDSFFCFPPFYTDFGKNISIGKKCFSTQAVLFRIEKVLRLEMEHSLGRMYSQEGK